MKKEVRNLDSVNSEIRIKDSRVIVGRGIVFNRESADLGGFREVILPQALNGVLERSDVMATLNHNIEKGILARSDKGKGSLKLEIEKTGLKYSFEAPKFSLGDELIENIRRGDIKGSSFSFTVAKNGERWEKRSDGKAVRTISQFENLYDISPCYKPSYENTEIALRSLEEFQKTTPKPSVTDNMTPQQEKIYRDFQLLKNKDRLKVAQEEIQKYGYAKKLPKT